MKLSGIPNVCPVPAELDLPDRVYKYRAVNEFLLPSLSLNQVWLAKPDTFNDPFEPERIFSGSTFSDALARDVREAGVLCLCKRNDNLAMWSYYGNALKGIAIGYDLANLVRSLEPVTFTQNECSPRWRYVYDLAYRDDGLSLIEEMRLLNTGNDRALEYQKMFATKAAVFSHEEECRVVVPPSPDSDVDYAWSGHGLYQHSPDAVKEIVFGELVTEQDRQAVMKILTGYEFGFFNAGRDKRSFKIQVTPA
jgi:hypothetical protein